MSIEAYTQKVSPHETRYHGSYNGTSYISLMNTSIEKDEFWCLQLKNMSVTPNTKYPNNRTIVVLDSTERMIESIYQCESVYNISTINHCFGVHNETFVTALIQYFKDTISKAVSFHVLNEVGFKCFYYVPESQGWKLPFTNYKRNTKVSICGFEYSETQCEYMKKLVFNDKYDLLFIDDKSKPETQNNNFIEIFQKMNSNMTEMIDIMKKTVPKELPPNLFNLRDTQSSPIPTLASSFNGTTTPTFTLTQTPVVTTSPSTTTFGSSFPSPSSTFGTTSPSTPTFGTTSTTSTFGSSFPSPSTTFGTTTPTFGSSFQSPSTFGTSTPTCGTTNKSGMFGNLNQVPASPAPNSNGQKNSFLSSSTNDVNSFSSFGSSGVFGSKFGFGK
jgi:hypothetical protein